MNTKGIIGTMLLVSALTFVWMPANAQHRHHRHARPVTTIVVKSGTSVQSGKKGRLSMAVNYLQSHKSLTVKRYAKMTGLTKAAAKSELDAFAADVSKPIMAVVNGKKTVYVKRP